MWGTPGFEWDGSAGRGGRAVGPDGGNVVKQTTTRAQVSAVWDAANSLPIDLSVGAVHLWQRDLRVSANEVARCYDVLATDERERAQRFRVERPREEFVLTRGTLRSLLGQYMGIPPQSIRFRYSSYGKPVLDGDDSLCFNVSHTEGRALLGFSRDRAVGVDVEKFRPMTDLRKLAERYFSATERGELRHLTGDELEAAFFRCWTRKEAYIKARGEGLSMPLDQFDVSVVPNDEDALLGTRPDPAEAERWTVSDVSVGSGYAAAVTVAAEENA